MPKKAIKPKMVFANREEMYGYFRKLKETGISDIEVDRLTGYAKSSVSHALHEKNQSKESPVSVKRPHRIDKLLQ